MIMSVRKWWQAMIPGSPVPDPIDTALFYRERCRELEERLQWSDQQLRLRSEKLYELQQQYSTEHFMLSESMRDLKTERLRNGGAYASVDTILSRAKLLQSRIHELKVRLRQYEDVEDLYFDTQPILLEDKEK